MARLVAAIFTGKLCVLPSLVSRSWLIRTHTDTHNCLFFPSFHSLYISLISSTVFGFFGNQNTHRCHTVERLVKLRES
jgi:hypothetical protein